MFIKLAVKVLKLLSVYFVVVAAEAIEKHRRGGWAKVAGAG